MVVAEITSRDEFDRLIDNDTVVLDLCMFNDDDYTDAQFEEISTKHPSIKFVKTDANQHPEVGGPRPRIFVPHIFQIFKDGECERQLFGDVDSLESAITEVDG